MSNPGAPNPNMFRGRRFNGVPNRSSMPSPSARHAFYGNHRPKGDQPDAQVLVDTGIFISVGSAEQINGVKLFGDHYAGRALTTTAIWDEVTRQANAIDKQQLALGAAAKRSQKYLLAMGRVEKRTLDVVASAGLLQRIHRQLVNIEAAQQSSAVASSPNLSKHAGEAELIAMAAADQILTLLTNDAGASTVAASQIPPIRALHFGDVLLELVCSTGGAIEPVTAAAVFVTACSLSGIPRQAKPTIPVTFVTCGQRGESGSECRRCA
jgi:hypothetical protein